MKTLHALKMLLWLTLTLLSSSLLVYQIIHHSPKPKKNAGQIDSFAEQLTIKQFNQQGQLKRQLQARYAAHRNKPEQIAFTEPLLDFYNAQQQHWQLHSQYGLSKNHQTEINVWGKVKLHRPADLKHPALNAFTEKLNYYPKLDLATTDQLITLLQPGIKVQAIGMRAYLTTGKIELLSETHAIYQPIG